MGNLGNVPLASARGCCTGAAGQGNAELRNAFLLRVQCCLWHYGSQVATPPAQNMWSVSKGVMAPAPKSGKGGGQGWIWGEGHGGAYPPFLPKNLYIY